MYDLGDVATLSVTTTNAAGQPENAGSVAITVTLPDGTTTAQDPVAPTDTGQYDFDYPTVQAGRHAVRWVATGANASSYEDAFHVEPADPGAFISLASAKTFMKKTGTADDEKIRPFVHAACAMIEERIGPVTPRTVVEDTSGRALIVLEHRPVVSVTSVQQLPGLAAIPAADASAGTAGWKLDGPAGLLTHTGSGFGDARVTYRPGRTPVAANIRLAGKELVAHLWRNSQLNAGGGGRPGLVDNEAPLVPGSAFALPIRVRELLGLNSRDQPTDEVLVL